MKLSVSQIVNSVPVLNKLKDEQLPVKLSYRVGRILEKFAKEYNLFEDTRLSLVKKYGVENTDGNFEVAEDKRSQFFKDLSDVLQEEVELSIPLIPLEMFPNSSLITPQDMVYISFLIEEPM